VDRIVLVQLTGERRIVVNTVMKSQVSYEAIKFVDCLSN